MHGLPGKGDPRALAINYCLTIMPPFFFGLMLRRLQWSQTRSISTDCLMASCYGSISAPGGGASQRLRYLPMETRLPDGTCVEIDHFRESEHAAGQRLLNGVIEEGLSWPFEEEMDMNAFRAYFLSHAAFVVRTVSPASSSCSSSCARPPGEERLGEEGSAPTAAGPDNRGPSGTALQSDGEDKEHEVGDEGKGVWGVFYIKPNFPGRCSHVCNGGFITDPRRRRRGVARLMGHAFLRLAKDLGYKASYFNLVFRSNEASLALWRGLGFTELAVVPKAGRLRGIDGLVDAIQFYYDLEALSREDLPEDLRGPS